MTPVDNTSNAGTTGYMFDVEIYLAIKLGTTAPNGDIYVAAFGSVDGTNYDMPVGASFTDAGITLVRTPLWDGLRIGDYIPGSGMRFFAKIDCYGQASGATVVRTLQNLARAFGGNLPASWGIAVFNQTGYALDSTEGNHTKKYRGLFNIAQ